MRRRTRNRAALAFVIVAGAAPVMSATPAQAAATVTIANWQMNEPPGATVMTDSSGNGIKGAIGSAVSTGVTVSGATGYSWAHGDPTAPPPKPGRLVQVADSRLNPGTRDYAVTIRFRTTHSYGNMIQKGQSGTPGGYFKWEIPKGRLMCLFRGTNSFGSFINKSVKSPLAMPLNDGAWHTVRCERTVDRVTMTIDGATTVQSSRGPTGSISNNVPLTIAGKLLCDQIETTCDYFAGNIDWIRIETSPSTSDVTPPTTPGRPSGVSNSLTTIDLNWAGSTDAGSSSLTYRVYRDGAWVASTASAGSTVSFTDTDLQSGSTHLYSIQAVDQSQNVSPMSLTSDPITVQSAANGIFADDFSSGTFSSWTSVTRLTIDGAQGSPAAPSAQAQVSSQSAFAYRNLGATYASACMSLNVNAASLGGNAVDLFRLRTATDGPIARAYVNASGFLSIRADFSAVQRSSGVVLGSGWHTIELCGTVGSATTWDLLRDGVVIVNDWVANTGTTPIGRISIGDTAAKTWSANFDHVVLDLAPGG